LSALRSWMKSGQREPAAAQFWGPGKATPARSRLLLISYHFPPGQAAGALRWQRLSSYAAERGWELDVIALHPSSISESDMSRLAGLPAGIRVYGICAPTVGVERLERSVWRMYRWLRPKAQTSFTTDTDHSHAASARPGSLGRHEIRWSRRDLLAGLRRAYYGWLDYSRHGHWAETAAMLGSHLATPGVHRAVVSCGPPHMVHEAARRLAREKGLPLVMDLRDPWSLVERLSEEIASPIWLAMAAHYERRVVADAALVVTNTEPARLAMQAAYPESADRIITVMNGYDEEAVPRSRHGGRFTIAYAGTIYLDRDPRPLFRAVAEVVRSLGLSPEEFRIELMGEVKSYDGRPIEAIARETGIEAFVRARPPGPRREVMDFLADATVLLSLPQDSHMAIPSKIFEYMEFDAWILALASPGSATEFLLRHSTADVVSPHDVHQIANALRRRYHQYRQGLRPSRLARNSRFSRRAQAELLFDAIERCVEGGDPDSGVGPSQVISLARRAKRKFERARILRRMQKVAWSSEELAARVARARAIHFVCHGNIIRSAFAAALLRERVRHLADIEVHSAGLWAEAGKSAHPTACSCAHQFGVDLTNHFARRVDPDALVGSDIVFVMEADQLAEIERRFPTYGGKVYLLGCLNAQGPLEISDPVYRPVEIFEACFRDIDTAVERLANLLVQRSRRQPHEEGDGAPCPPNQRPSAGLGAPLPPGQNERGVNA
jgi:protein-tyrosine-phosphatase